MKFSIVIPAYNEERAVEAILRRCLAASGKITEAGLGVTAVEVILVNDGSADRTEELARSVPGVRVLAHERNRGYGAAIKTGFGAAGGELLGFIDADGTCDPDFFVPLLRKALAENLDVALGSRMHPESKMPAVRVLGNLGFRTIVNLIGASSVTDVASGMRVLRRAALRRLYPLPDGLHFTPAMSVRGVLDSRIRMGEMPMPYEERVGRSKLSVVKDGVRFLEVILDTAVTYRPLLFFGMGAAGAALLAALGLLFSWGGPAAPLPYYVRNGRLEEWMIFRIVLVSFFLSAAAFLVALGAAAQSFVGIINEDSARAGLSGFIGKHFAGRFNLWAAACFALAVVLNRRLLAAYFGTGNIPGEFWVFPVVGSLLALMSVQFVAFGLVERIARLLRERARAREAQAQ